VIDAGHDPEQGALAGPVGAQDADLGPGKEREIDPLEDFPAGRDDLPEILHREDVLVAWHVAAKITGSGFGFGARG
jgi:hypothetical protein